MGLLQNLIFAIVEETIEGTPETDIATSVVKLGKDAKPPKIGKALIDAPEMSGSLSPEDPIVGQDSVAFELPIVLKGSGKRNTPPEFDVLMKNTFGVRTNPAAGTVSPVKTASTTIYTVTGSGLASPNKILVKIGATYEEVTVSSVTPGTGVQVVTASAASLAPVNGATIVSSLVNGTVAASPAPTTTTFDLTGGTLTAGDEILVEIGATYQVGVVDTVTPGAGVQSIILESALTVPPSTGADVHILTPHGYVVVASAPAVGAFSVVGSTLTANDAILVAIGAAFEETWVVTASDTLGSQALTVSPVLSQAPATDGLVYPGVTYKLSSDQANFLSMTAVHYVDGIKIVTPGCRGNVAFQFNANDVPMATFSMEGMNWTATNAVCAFTPTYQNVRPFIVSQGSWKLGAAEEYIENFAIDLGWTVAKLNAIQASGVYDIFLSKRDPNGSFDPFANSVTHLTAWKAMTPATVTFKIGDTTNMILMKLPRIIRREVTFADKEGVNTFDIAFAASKTVANDEVFLSFLSITAP